MIDAAGKTAVIACEILRREVESLQRTVPLDLCARFVDQDLHRTPERMPAALQEAVDEAAGEPGVTRVVLGYGLCSNGLVGVRAPAQGLIVPRVHDCVALVLGSRAEYDRQFRACPGTYYLTASWIDHDRDPLGTMEREYAPRMGRETAEWGMRQELKNTTRIALVDSGVCEPPCRTVRERARRNAEFFEMNYEELTGSGDLLRRLLTGPCDGEDFLQIAPGEPIRQEMFL